MGLDMYLDRKQYVQNWSHQKESEKHHIFGTAKGHQIDMKNLKYLQFEVMYWRKANWIHKWFIDNIQDGIDDCGTYDVTSQQIEELVSLCKQVLKYLKNEKSISAQVDIINDMLPPQSGFFFGNEEMETNDDIEYYIDTLKETIQELGEVKTPKKGFHNDSFYYHASW